MASPLNLLYEGGLFAGPHAVTGVKLGLLPNTEVEFEVVGRAVRMLKVRRAAGARRSGKSIDQRLRGRGSVRTTTDEIPALPQGER